MASSGSTTWASTESPSPQRSTANLLRFLSGGTAQAVRVSNLTLGAVVAFVAASACSQPASTDDVMSFFDRRSRVICEKNFECCTGGQLLSPSIESCVESDRLYAARQQVASAVRDGTGSFDAKAGAGCLAAVEALDCSGWADAIAGADPAACRAVIRGNGRVGAGCATDYECGSLYCDQSAGAKAGVCKEKGEVGATCQAFEPGCVEGVSCLASGVCTARLAAGGSCSRGIECQSGSCASGACDTVCWGEVLSTDLFGI